MAARAGIEIVANADEAGRFHIDICEQKRPRERRTLGSRSDELHSSLMSRILNDDTAQLADDLAAVAALLQTHAQSLAAEAVRIRDTGIENTGQRPNPVSAYRVSADQETGALHEAARAIILQYTASYAHAKKDRC